MKKITNSFIRNIVRQSLNESYGLLNEYDITTKTKIVLDLPTHCVILVSVELIKELK